MLLQIYNKIVTHWKRIVAGVAALILGAILLLARGCGKSPAAPSPLQPGEIARVEVDGKKVRITTEKGTTEQYVPDTAKVTVRTDGVVDVKVQKVGIKAELGGGTVITPTRMKLELDTRIIYAWKFSLHGGFTLDPAAQRVTEYVRPLFFVAYPLPFKLTPNTSAFIGVEVPVWVGQTTVPCGGLRVRF